jgi:hypothetical protein
MKLGLSLLHFPCRHFGDRKSAPLGTPDTATESNPEGGIATVNCPQVSGLKGAFQSW